MFSSLPYPVRRWCASPQAFALYVFFACSINAFAQKQEAPKFKLGLVDRASLEMAAYPGDSTADAVYLYDFGNTTFSYDELRGLLMYTKMWVRIKILKESALDRASVGVPYYYGSSFKEQENIEDLEGYTYNLEDGRIITTQLDKKSIKREKTAERYYTTKFNLPNVKKGSVIEYSYTMVSPMSVRPKPRTWTFQGSVPVKWSEYRIIIPFFLEYKMTMGGYLELAMNEREQINANVGHTKFDGPALSYRFAVKDAPAFVDEPYITTPSDYLSKISFELAGYSMPGEPVKNLSRTWENVERTLEEESSFGGELRKSSFIKEVKEGIAAKTADPMERMNLGYEYLQKTMKWNGEGGLWSGEGVRKAFENKKGNAGDINLMLTILLRELDLEADPVLLSTRSHGRIIREIPMIESFNYIISHVKVADKVFLLDATQPYARPGMLPEHALNGFGRLIPKKGQGRFVDILPIESQSKLEMINASIVPEEGTIKGKYNASLGGYEALKWREKYATEQEKVIHENLRKTVPEWTMENIAIKNTADLRSTVSVGCDFEAGDENASPEVFYFNPILAGRWVSNPLKSKDRIYPLDLTTGISNSFIGNFELPEGYVIEEIPKAEILTLPEKAGKFVYQVKQTGNVIQVNSQVLVTKVQFMPDEYGNLKEFFERVVQKHSQPLIIKKQAK
jgi:hypothetical protein